MFASLYVSRPLLNAGEVAAHFARQGLQSVQAPSDMHVTIVYSKQPLEWAQVGETAEHFAVTDGKRSLERLGPEGAIVLRFESYELTQRWREYRAVGATHDWDSYRAHVTITWNSQGIDIDKLMPFKGPLHFGPERRRQIDDEWKPKEISVQDFLDKAVVARLPVVIKALPQTDVRRIVEIDASCEAVDYDGDVVMQKALLDSAASFVSTGHLDIDHLSEFATRLGLPEPPSHYIVGRPLDVIAGPNQHTFVRGEISRSIDGQVDPLRNRYDELWLSLQREPPVQWFASIYGFPIDVEDCESGKCASTGATRFVIKSIDWRSLAFTRTPKNTALRETSRIVTAKSYLTEILKSMSPPVVLPQNMQDISAAQPCQKCEVHKAPSLLGYRQHFEACKGWPPGIADMGAHAAMHRHAMERAMGGLLQTPTITPVVGQEA
jgi:hypothetical protein